MLDHLDQADQLIAQRPARRRQQDFIGQPDPGDPARPRRTCWRTLAHPLNNRQLSAITFGISSKSRGIEHGSPRGSTNSAVSADADLGVRHLGELDRIGRLVRDGGDHPRLVSRARHVIGLESTRSAFSRWTTASTMRLGRIDCIRITGATLRGTNTSTRPVWSASTIASATSDASTCLNARASGRPEPSSVRTTTASRC